MTLQTARRRSTRSVMNDVVTHAKHLLNQSGQPKRRAVPRVSPRLHQADHHMVGEEGAQIASWHLLGHRYEAPPVLLVHGWEDDTSLWSPLIDLLNQRGRSIVAFDLPGHGHSDGDRCSLELAADAILALQARFGPFAGAATHSFGGPALAKAFQHGLELDHVVLISPPVAQARQFERAWRRYGVDEPMIEAALALGHQEGRFFDLAAAAPSMKAEALFIHSLDDEQCPASEGKRAAEAWPGARFWPVDGLGHRALVQDDEVVSMAASWLDS
ncbi:MAG: hypothetical protein RL230_2197 [Pseudomonadota bacterium]